MESIAFALQLEYGIAQCLVLFQQASLYCFKLCRTHLWKQIIELRIDGSVTPNDPAQWIADTAIGQAQGRTKPGLDGLLAKQPRRHGSVLHSKGAQHGMQRLRGLDIQIQSLPLTVR
ncbi:hypothetical protein D3C72_1352080 [compost metagenome]